MKKLSDCRLLLVDDAKANLDILVEGLKRDYKLSLALDGEKALELAARLPPDLVLLDIMMPGIDGYEVCRRLRAQPETSEIPIIFLSSLDEAQNKARGFEAGANDYVTKPFDILEVQARVRSLLKAKAYNDAVKEQMAGELRVAREIQMGLVPHRFDEFEQQYGVRLAATLEPAREVGGDLYGVFAAAADRLVLVMGDVSGKGIPASLFMVRTSSLIRLLAQDIAEPERILARLNDELAADNPSEMFVTVVCAVFDPSTRRLCLASGGHTRPVLLRAGAAPQWLGIRPGTALALEPGIAFERHEIQLHPSDTVLFYTDGVTEAFNPSAECYGSDRLLADLGPLTGQPSTGVIPGLLQNVRAFAAGAPPSDDLALLVLQVGPDPGAEAAVTPRRVSMEVPATAADVMRAVERLQSFGREEGIPEKTLFGLALALEETGSNIVRHGYEEDASRRFSVMFERDGRRVTLELRDSGPPFDPTHAEAPDAGEELEDRAPGGWGLSLARHYVDETRYERVGNENVLRLVKYV